MKVPYRDYILGHLKASGKNVKDLAMQCGVSKDTIYRKLREPDTIDRNTLRILHKVTGISYEELIERR